MNGNDLTPIPELRSDVYPINGQGVCQYHAGLTNKITQIDSTTSLEIKRMNKDINNIEASIKEISDNVIRSQKDQEYVSTSLDDIKLDLKELTTSIKENLNRTDKLEKNFIKTTATITTAVSIIIVFLKLLVPGL